MPKFVRVKIGENPQKPIAVLSIPGRSKKQAVQNAKRVLRRHFKNVIAGFKDSSGFHPIRASADYKPSRAGEKMLWLGKKKRITKAKEKKYKRTQKVGQYF